MAARKSFFVLAVVFTILFASQAVWADRPDHAGGPGDPGDTEDIGGPPESASPDDVGYGDGLGYLHRHKICLQPGARSGLIKTNRQMLYSGGELALEITLPHSLEGFWSGEADAHVVIEDPLGTFFYGTVNAAGLDSQNPHISLKIGDVQSVLPDGNYQIAIILTKANGEGEAAGNPLNLENWYQGFQGFVAVSRVKVAFEGDPEDLDADGTVDGDEDADGYSE
jgi:hypothetical protein